MKMNDLKYPDECARCNANACSDCGHRHKKANAIHNYFNQFNKTFCKLCNKIIDADVTKYPDEFDNSLCPDCNTEYVV